MNKYLLTIFSVVLLLPSAVHASGSDSVRNFEHITEMDGLRPKVYAIAQDNTGYLWFGTDNGVIRYDGYRYRHYDLCDGDDSFVNKLRINVLCKSSDGSLYVGADNGIYLYDRDMDRFSKLDCSDGRHVKALVVDGGMLWAGTTTGLLRVKLDSDDAVSYGHASGLPSEHVSSAAEIGGHLYFGSYNYIYEYDGTGGFGVTAIPYASRYPNNMVLAIAADAADSDVIWLGTERGLIRFDLSDGSSAMYLANNPVKAFYYDDDGNLWVGTDNGLYISAGDGSFVKYGHEVGNSRSIVNDVVWCISRDMTGNVWLGTDGGVSTMLASRAYRVHGIREITGSTDGNDIMALCRDSRGVLWLGGFGGLVGYDAAHGRSIWLRADKGPASRRLSHNKVRDLYDDGSMLWIATDGGLNSYEYDTGRVCHYVIEEPGRTYSSNWMYVVEEDADGNLWLGTYDGGLFVIFKRRLADGGSGTYVADRHYALGDGQGSTSIPSNIVSAVSVGPDGIFVGTGTGGAVFSRDGGQSFMALPGCGDVYVNDVDRDDDGRLWLATNRGLMRFDAVAGSVDTVVRQSGGVGFVALNGNDVWFSTPEGVACIDTSGGSRTNYVVSGHNLNCAIYDSVSECLCLGTVDGYIELEPDAPAENAAVAGVAITDLFIDGTPVSVGAAYGGNTILKTSVARQRKVTLRHDQNTFSVAFSQFRFMSPVKVRYAYRLAGLDDTWQLLDNVDNKVTFIGVPAGKYRFEVCRAAPDGTHEGDTAALDIRIRPVWYRSGYAVAAYVVAVIMLLYVGWLVLRARHRRGIERARQAEALRFADMKLDFMSNIAHEFKTPLTLIINRMQAMQMQRREGGKDDPELVAIRRNVDKIHSLINSMAEFNDNNAEPLFLPTETLAPDFVRSCFDQFDKEFRRKGIDARFESDDIPYAFMWDHARMESVFTNIISNAVKFTPEGGRITVSVRVTGQTAGTVTAEIRVEDNGVGIAPEELPNIFDKYYTARSNSNMNRGGTGIGLYLVRQFVEKHGGTVGMTSEPGRGTAVSVVVSADKSVGYAVDDDGDEAVAVHNLKKEWPYDRKPKVMVVEDNAEISGLVAGSLSPDFDVVAACNGNEALERIVADMPDLVVTDLVMPGMDGMELCRRLRNNIATAMLPIIVLTGKVDRRTEIDAFEFADAFIAKPFNAAYLKNRIVQLLIRHEKNRRKAAERNLITPQRGESLSSPDELFLQRVMEVVEANISDSDFNASILCDKCGYSSKQVYRKIKQLTGLTTVEFIRDIRLKKAAIFLGQDKLTVSEIMYMVGFTNNSYFAQCFKQKYGISPSEYAKSRGENGVER